MAFSTGDQDQPDLATVTLSVPVKHDGDANDYILAALTGALNLLTFPGAWNAEGHSQTIVQAAAYAQIMFDSMTVTWP